jgi:hypothetical protein
MDVSERELSGCPVTEKEGGFEVIGVWKKVKQESCRDPVTVLQKQCCIPGERRGIAGYIYQVRRSHFEQSSHRVRFDSPSRRIDYRAIRHATIAGGDIRFYGLRMKRDISAAVLHRIGHGFFDGLRILFHSDDLAEISGERDREESASAVEIEKEIAAAGDIDEFPDFLDEDIE